MILVTSIAFIHFGIINYGDAGMFAAISGAVFGGFGIIHFMDWTSNPYNFPRD